MKMPDQLSGKSRDLIDRVAREATFGPNAGSELARLALEMATEYETAVRSALRLEETIHRFTK